MISSNPSLFLLIIFLWIFCSSHLFNSSFARSLPDSVRVFIVDEDDYNYLQNYLHQYDMKKSSKKDSDAYAEEKRVAIIMGIQKKNRNQQKKEDSSDLPAPIKGFFNTDRRLDEEQLTEPSAQYVMPPPEFQLQQQQQVQYQEPVQYQQAVPLDPMADQMEELASDISPSYPLFYDYDDEFLDSIRDSGYNDLEADAMMSYAPMSSSTSESIATEPEPPLISYRQSYFPAQRVMYHLFKKKK